MQDGFASGVGVFGSDFLASSRMWSAQCERVGGEGIYEAGHLEELDTLPRGGRFRLREQPAADSPRRDTIR